MIEYILGGFALGFLAVMLVAATVLNWIRQTARCEDCRRQRAAERL